MQKLAFSIFLQFCIFFACFSSLTQQTAWRATTWLHECSIQCLRLTKKAWMVLRLYWQSWAWSWFRTIMKDCIIGRCKCNDRERQCNLCMLSDHYKASWFVDALIAKMRYSNKWYKHNDMSCGMCVINFYLEHFES